ncbi:MAG: hypothetical protein HY865_23690 [Chloroflexi bacterium]|nr:hypothetical protein [Chloroflexota bacterium]
MKKYWLFILVAIFLLNACTPSALPPATETVIPTATATFSPTSTPTLSTPTITPLPTIPTFTPTFDTSTIVTVTPAPKAECPKENPELIPDFPYCYNGDCSGGPYHNATLNYLNAGGALDKLEKKHWGTIQDLTGDEIKEIARSDNGYFYVYGCREHKYMVLLKIEGTQNTPSLDNVVDLNGNGLPELIVSNYERRAFRSIRIFEWDRNEFRSLIEGKFISYSNNPEGETIKYDWLGGTVLTYKTTDTNNDGVKEIVAIDEVPYDPSDISSGIPWRDRTIRLEWDGINYTVGTVEYTPPQYRFQAIQDADIYVKKHNFEKAFLLYQDAIFDKELDWWSRDRKEYESKLALEMWFQNAMKLMVATATPFPTLPTVVADNTEYPRLAAYAYYRIMLLHLAQGQESNADTTYDTLQQTFGSNPYGRPYVEMATAFRDAYQSTQKMYDGCATAIQYAAEHPEILIPLGSDYHGAQSQTYKPEDVCPFR